MTSGQFVQKKLETWAARKGISLQALLVSAVSAITRTQSSRTCWTRSSVVSKSFVRARRRRRTPRQHSNDVRAPFVGGNVRWC